MPNQRYPTIEIESILPHTLSFTLAHTDVSMANSLRRVMIGEVPTLAIDMVEFEDNTSVLQDEYIAHRLGMIPVGFVNSEGRMGDPTDRRDRSGQGRSQQASSDNRTFRFQRECDCQNEEQYCEQCGVMFELKVEYDEVMRRRKEEHMMGGDEDGDLVLDEKVIVTSRDLISSNDRVKIANFLSDTEEDSSYDKGITIVKLSKGQRLHLKCVAYLGISKEHAKWCPCAVANYKFWPEIHINKEAIATLTTDQRRALVAECPDHILEYVEESGEIVSVDNAHKIATFTEDLAMLQNSMKDQPEDEDFVSVVQSESRFYFTIESSGSMDAEEIVKSALKVLRAKLETVKTETEALDV